MASAFSHIVPAIAFGKIGYTEKQPWKFWVLGCICSAIPDADALGYKLGVPYESMWGHRGITHSFAFAILLGLLVTAAFFRGAKFNTRPFYALWLYFFICTASHCLLDAMTTGGLGVAFFAPFDNSRYFLPWRMIKVSPISITRFFSSRGLQVLASEFVWIWIPFGVLTVVWLAVRKLIKR
jgi:inner membrane protein